MPSLIPFPGKRIPPYGLGLKPMRGPLEWARDKLLFGVVLREYTKAMLPRLNALRADAGLAPVPDPIANLYRPDRLLATTGAPLEYPRVDTPAHVRFVGAQLWDARRPHGVGELPRADNVRVERFVAHGPVLERAVAVVCHGGMGIVQKGVAAGVPIVAVPFGRDQPEVGRRIAESGAGVLVKRSHQVRGAPGARHAPGRGGLPWRPAEFAGAVEEIIPAGLELEAHCDRSLIS